MSDKIEPALSPEEWTAIAEKREYLQPSIVDDLCVLDSSDLARAIAYANAKLPDDSPYKITRADVAALTDAARHIERDYRKPDDPAYLRAVAAKLAALLPPE